MAAPQIIHVPLVKQRAVAEALCWACGRTVRDVVRAVIGHEVTITAVCRCGESWVTEVTAKMLDA